MFKAILQKFAERSPITVMVQGLLEHLLNAKKIDDLFETVSEIQYTRKILFSSLVSIMLQVVCRVRKNVYSSYINSNIDATRMAVYDKLKNIEPKTSREIVCSIATESEIIIREMKGGNPPILPGFRTKFLDGNCIESTEHRIKPLRETRAGALPGKSLVVFDPELGIAIDVIPCENGHTQERALLPYIIEKIEPKDLWIADRNFCVINFMFKIHQKNAFFVLRKHGATPCNLLSEKEFVGNSETGKVYEQQAQILHEDNLLMLRLIIIELDNKTRNNDNTLFLFTNLPINTANAISVAGIYRKRWGIETAFQKLESYLNSEINSLGYPKAALFGFCMALVAFNMYAVIMAALRAAHPDKNIDDEVSDYYIAEEIATIYNGMNLFLEKEDWIPFVERSASEIAIILLYLASHVNLKKFKKHKRGPKKPPLPKNKFIGKPHVATAKLLV